MCAVNFSPACTQQLKLAFSWSSLRYGSVLGSASFGRQLLEPLVTHTGMISVLAHNYPQGFVEYYIFPRCDGKWWRITIWLKIWQCTLHGFRSYSFASFFVLFWYLCKLPWGEILLKTEKIPAVLFPMILVFWKENKCVGGSHFDGTSNVVFHQKH